MLRVFQCLRQIQHGTKKNGKPQSSIIVGFLDKKQIPPKQWLAGLIILSKNESMKYGYARVSTGDQKADLQTAALDKAGCGRVFTDVASGASAGRPELARCLKSLRAGDVLVVWKLDRLGRSLPHLVAVLAELQARGVAFQSLTEAIDTGSAAGRLMGHILGALAEFERSLIVERTQAGLQAAKRRGQRLGRRPALSPEQVRHARALLADGESPAAVARLLKVCRATLYNSLRRG
jgi:DNA invertase Pin-like site-specific DNA recombinase